MSRPLRVGLTGGIGSGKSEVSRRFAERGIAVIDTDVIARERVEPGRPALQEIVATFGSEVLDADGRLKREQLRSLVFADPEKRRQLEAILHPRIRDRALALADTAESPYCLIVIPLLVETGNDYSLDRILVVDTPEAMQIERVIARDQLSQQEIRAILNSQSGRQQRLTIADDVIVNDSSVAHMKGEVERLDRLYRQLAADWKI